MPLAVRGKHHICYSQRTLRLAVRTEKCGDSKPVSQIIVKKKALSLLRAFLFYLTGLYS